MPKPIRVLPPPGNHGPKVDECLVVCHNARLVRERSHRLHEDCMKTIGASQNLRDRSQLLMEQNKEIMRNLK